MSWLSSHVILSCNFHQPTTNHNLPLYSYHHLSSDWNAPSEMNFYQQRCVKLEPVKCIFFARCVNWRGTLIQSSIALLFLHQPIHQASTQNYIQISNMQITRTTQSLTLVFPNLFMAPTRMALNSIHKRTMRKQYNKDVQHQNTHIYSNY